MDKSSEIQVNLDRLHDLMNNAISSRGNLISCRLLWLIGRWLRQFNLNSRIDPDEILTEAYLRTYDQILQGKQISNFPAWLNKVSYKIIQEHSKKAKYRDLLEQRLFYISQQDLENINNSNASIFRERRIEALQKAWTELKEEEVEILDLRIIQGFSWKEVSNYWKTTQGKEMGATLLKQGFKSLTISLVHGTYRHDCV